MFEVTFWDSKDQFMLTVISSLWLKTNLQIYAYLNVQKSEKKKGNLNIPEISRLTKTLEVENSKLKC